MEDDMDETSVKHLALDFETGQRVLSQVHLLCQVSRLYFSAPLCTLPFTERQQTPDGLKRSRAFAKRPRRRWMESNLKSTR